MAKVFRLTTKSNMHVTETEEVKYRSKWPKVLIIILAIILLIYSYKFLIAWFQNVVQLNPYVYSTYLYITNEIESRSLLGLFFACFFGSIFFITIPVELVFIYYLGTDYFLAYIILITLVGNVLGLIIDYLIGFFLGEKLLKLFMKDNYDRYKRKTNRIGSLLIILGNIIPFPIEIVSVFLGGVRYNFLKFVTFSTLGKLAKFLLLFIGFKYYQQYLSPLINSFLIPWLTSIVDKLVALAHGLI